MRSHSLGPFSFIFSKTNCQIIRWRSHLWGWGPPPVWEILDPPLVVYNWNRCYNKRCFSTDLIPLSTYSPSRALDRHVLGSLSLYTVHNHQPHSVWTSPAIPGGPPTFDDILPTQTRIRFPRISDHSRCFSFHSPVTNFNVFSFLLIRRIGFPFDVSREWVIQFASRAKC